MNIFFKVAYRNTIRNWRKSSAAIVSIAAGFISLVLFQGYIADVDRMYDVAFTHRAMYGNLLIENKFAGTNEGRMTPENFYLTLEEQNKITSFLELRKDQIVTRVRFLPVTGTVTNGKNSFIFLAMGHDVIEGELVRRPNWSWDTLYGQPLHAVEDKSSVVLGQALGYLVGCVPDHPDTKMVQNNGYVAEVRPFTCDNFSLQLATTTLSGQVNALDLNVVGLIDGGYKDIDQRWMKMHLETAQTLLNTDKIRFQSVLLKDEKQTDPFIKDLNAYFESEKLPLTAMRWMEHSLANLLKQTKSLLRVFHIFIVLIILLIAGLSVFNTMVKNVKERTREIGTLRSLGYKNKDISLIFALEAAYTCLLGVALGLVLSLGVTALVNNMRILYKAGLLSMPVLFQIGFDLQAYVTSISLLTLLAIGTSILAIRSTLRARVADNLTHV